MSTEETQQPQVTYIEINDENCDQRIDNFLITHLKGVPKSRIYRIVRKGEVRVNKGLKNLIFRKVYKPPWQRVFYMKTTALSF